jgi:hypothetical protein
MKHNKKRNTAFLYETLVREGTKAAIAKNTERMNAIKQILLEYFKPNTVLFEELKLYNALRVPDVEKSLSDRYLVEVKNRHMCLDKRTLFNEQTKLINQINKTLGFDVYNNFVPFYKDLATISQIFNDNTSIKEKLLLEQEVLNRFSTLTEQKDLKPIDNLVYKTFVKKFNDKYSNLLGEQKELLSKYINSFADDGLEMKIYLNEHLESLKEKVNKAILSEEIKSDAAMLEKTQKLLSVMDGFKKSKEFSVNMLESLLKIQEFVHEVEKND